MKMQLYGLVLIAVLAAMASTQPELTAREERKGGAENAEIEFQFWAETGTAGHMSLPPEVNCIEVSPDEKTLAVGYEDSAIRIWSLQTGNLEKVLTGHSGFGGVLDIRFSPDGSILASAGGYDKSLRLWDLKTGKALATLEGHKTAVRCLTISPDGKTIASGDGEIFAEGPVGEVRVWSLPDRRFVRVLATDLRVVRALSFSRDGNLLAAAGLGIWVWNFNPGTLKYDFQRHLRGGMAGPAIFSPQMDFLAVGGERGLEIWDLNKGTLKKAEELGVVTSLSYSPAGDFLACGSGKIKESGKILILTAENAQCSQRLEGLPDLVKDVRFWAQGQAVVYGCINGVVGVWNRRLAVPLLNLLVLPSQGKTVSPNWAAYTPDGYYICSNGAEALMTVKSNGKVLSREEARSAFCKPEAVKKALLRGKEAVK